MLWASAASSMHSRVLGEPCLQMRLTLLGGNSTQARRRRRDTPRTSRRSRSGSAKVTSARGLEVLLKVRYIAAQA